MNVWVIPIPALVDLCTTLFGISLNALSGRTFYDNRRGMQLQTQCSHNFENGGKFGIAVRGERFVQALSPKARLSSYLRHSLRSRDIAQRSVNAALGPGYGIFSGATVRWAKLRFSAERARWVSRELWHPLQRTAQDENGRLILEVPFTDMRELSMDILRHGHHVEVLEPSELRLEVQSELRQALNQYGNGD